VIWTIFHISPHSFSYQLSSEQYSTFLPNHSILSINIWTIFHNSTHSFSPINYHLNNIPHFYPFILACQLSSQQYSTFLPIHSLLSIIIWTKFHISTHLFSPVNCHLNNIPHFYPFILSYQLSSEQYSTFLPIHSLLSIVIQTIFHNSTCSFSPVNYRLNNIPHLYPFILSCQMSSEKYSTLLPIHSLLSIIIWTIFHISTHSFSPINYHLNNIPHFYPFILSYQLLSEQYSTFLPIHSLLPFIIWTIFHISTHSFSPVNCHLNNFPRFYPFILSYQLSSEQYSIFLPVHSLLSIIIWTIFHISTHSFCINYHLNYIPYFYLFSLSCQLSSEQYSTFLPIHSIMCIIYSPFCPYKWYHVFSKPINTVTQSTYHFTINGNVGPLTCQYKLSHEL
jgi:hypothetical protein